MNNNQHQPNRVEPLYCPTCPNTRGQPTDLVCGDCYRQYTSEAAIVLAKKGGKFLDLFSWVGEKAPAILNSLEEQYASAKAGIEKLQEEVGKEAFATLKQNSGGKSVPREVWSQAWRQKKQDLWRQKGGNVKFARMKGLESRIALLKGILKKAEPVAPVAEPEPAETVVTQPVIATPETEPEVKPRRRQTKRNADKERPRSDHRTKVAAIRERELEEEAAEVLS